MEQIVRYPEYTFELSAYNNRSIPALKMYGYNIKFITEAKTMIVDSLKSSLHLLFVITFFRISGIIYLFPYKFAVAIYPILVITTFVAFPPSAFQFLVTVPDFSPQEPKQEFGTTQKAVV